MAKNYLSYDSARVHEAVKSLIALLGLHKNASRSIRRGIFDDLTWKSHRLTDIQRLSYLRQATKLTGGDELDPTTRLVLSGDFANSEEEEQSLVDVGIVTARDFERKALLSVFGVDHRKKPNVHERGRSYWLCSVHAGAVRVRIAVTCVGAPRNVPAALATSDLIRVVKPKLCLMVGIGAGLKKVGKNPGVRLFDVVLARRVLDYEHVRLQVPDKRTRSRSFFEGLDRPDQFSVSKEMVALLDMVGLEREYWLHQLNSYAKKLKTKQWNLQKPSAPQVHDGVMLAGEKLIANGKLKDVRLKLHDQIRGADMEDSGFAQACEAESTTRINWAVVRGISDYGDGQKGKHDHTQPIAAASAAIVAQEVCMVYGKILASQLTARRIKLLEKK